MGTWGTGLYSDDLAADLRDDFRGYIGEGLSPTAAVDRLMSEYASSLGDSHEEPVFWLALADAGWKLGRLDERVRQNALRIIDNGRDLARWESARDRQKRGQVLAKLRGQLLAAPPAPKRLAKLVRSATEWTVGEVIAFLLSSDRWALMRVIGFHEDKGGRAAVCELLDWTGETIPSAEEITRLSVRREAAPRATSQFLFQEPRTQRDKTRIRRTGVRSTLAQECGVYTALVWPYVDRQLHEIFGLD